MKKINITEEMSVHKEWYEEARVQTIETLPDFLKKLRDDYRHDYGTVCHAVASSAIGAAWASQRDYGITGFQAGAVMWEFVKNWSYPYNKTGLSILDYDKMLYPQYEDNFQKTISESMWQIMKEEAKRLLSEKTEFTSERVISHWESIVDGVVPFGYQVEG